MAEIIKPIVKVERAPLVARPFKIIKYDSNGNVSKKYFLMDTLSPSKNAIDRAEDYEIRKKAGDPNYLSSIGTREILEDVANSGNSELQNYVRDSLRKYWIATTSVVEYNPKNQKDEVFHNWKTSDEYSLIRSIVGRDGFIMEIDNSESLESLVGTDDVKKLHEISNVINDSQMYLLRFNSKPSEKTKSVVRFGALDDRLYLDADGNLSDEIPAFLVLRDK